MTIGYEVWTCTDTGQPAHSMRAGSISHAPASPHGHDFGGRDSPSDRQTSVPADASRVRSRWRLQVVFKKIYPGKCAAFLQGAPPCTLKCKAPASRWMPIASQA